MMKIALAQIEARNSARVKDRVARQRVRDIELRSRDELEEEQRAHAEVKTQAERNLKNSAEKVAHARKGAVTA